MVGSVPGCPRQTGQVWELGSSPKESSQPQNIFVLVESWTWISRLITASRSAIGLAPPRDRRSPRLVEVEVALEREGGLQEGLLGEGRGGDLEADGQPRPAALGLCEPGGD